VSVGFIKKKHTELFVGSITDASLNSLLLKDQNVRPSKLLLKITKLPVDIFVSKRVASQGWS
jgi:hypothetical protein